MVVTSRKQQELALKEQQMEAEADCVNYIQQGMERLRILRHDCKEQIAAMDVMIQQNKWDETYKYCRQLDRICSTCQVGYIQNMPGMSAWLLRKSHEAEQRNIVFDADVPDEIDTEIPDAELSPVVYNLVNNAFEAIERDKPEERWVNLKLEVKGRQLFIRCENPIVHQPVVTGGRFRSSKENKDEHGLGMKSIQQTVEKYGGALSAQVQEHIFVVSAFLNLETV